MTEPAARVDADTPKPDLEARTKAATQAIIGPAFYGATAERLAAIALDAAGVPALITENERLQERNRQLEDAAGLLSDQRTSALEEARVAHWKHEAELSRLRQQRQAALDLCNQVIQDAEKADSRADSFNFMPTPRAVPIAALRAALGATE